MAYLELNSRTLAGSTGDHGHDGVADTAADPAVCEDELNWVSRNSVCPLSPPPRHLSWSCDSQIENNLALLEEKAEKDLAALYREKEHLQQRVLELRHQLLLQQRHQEVATILDAQVGLSMLLRLGVHEGARIRMPPLTFYSPCLGS